jgi:hypothetical protein
MAWRHLGCAFPPGRRGAVPHGVHALRAADQATVRDAAAGRSPQPEAPPTFAAALAAASASAGGSAGGTPAASPLAPLRPPASGGAGAAFATPSSTPGNGAAAASAAAADAAAEREACIGVLATNIVGCRYYDGKHTHTHARAFTP